MPGLCERHGISQSEFYGWRDAALGGAARALKADSEDAGTETPPVTAVA